MCDSSEPFSIVRCACYYLSLLVLTSQLFLKYYSFKPPKIHCYQHFRSSRGTPPPRSAWTRDGPGWNNLEGRIIKFTSVNDCISRIHVLNGSRQFPLVFSFDPNLARQCHRVMLVFFSPQAARTTRGWSSHLSALYHHGLARP